MGNLATLKHTIKPLASGGLVMLLDTGAIINPESDAMLQALHSRSTGGVENHLKILAERGPENFMENFYVGYGHKSIGDCGTITLFIEGVSMLVAKAIQDTRLYSGQEASTRYVDFSKQKFLDPSESGVGNEILETWRAFYLDNMETIRKSLEKRFPRKDGESEKVYKKAISARAFDIMRSFLPAGATTNLAWHTNLRQAADHILHLRNHPLSEVREVALALESILIEKYPSSFSHKRHKKTEEYLRKSKIEYYYHNPVCPDFKLSKLSIDESMLPSRIISERPEKTELPKWLAEAGHAQFQFLLDFGSFRDIHRHRAVIQRMPLLTMDLGFGNWYLSELPKNVRKKAEKLLADQKVKINTLNLSKEEAQYFIPMGYLTSNRITGNLPALVYLIELRSTHHVHPTLRKRALQMAKTLQEKIPYLKLYVSQEEHRFDITRGSHDIELK